MVIHASVIKQTKKNKLASLWYVFTVYLLVKRINKIAKTNRDFICVRETLLLKVFYKYWYDKTVNETFIISGYRVFYSKKGLIISWD